MNAKQVEKKPAIEREYDLDNDDDKEMYDQALDECYEPFMNQYPASEVLEQIDKCAYQEGFNDYIDGQPQRWECPECGEIYEDEQEAIDCCQEDLWECENCGEQYPEEELAEKCCTDNRDEN